MKTVLIIQADTNDADYITAECEVTQNAIDFITNKIIPALKSNHGRWYTGDLRDKENMNCYKDILTDDEIEKFSGMLPWGNDVHSVTSIRLVVIASDTQIFCHW